jgi:hypothetical protein
MLKRLISLSSVALLCGCSSVTITTSYIDTEGKPRSEKLHAISFFAKNNLDKIDVLSKTKTTSKVLGAKGLDNAVDSEGIGAANNVIKSIVEGAVIGASKSVKP